MKDALRVRLFWVNMISGNHFHPFPHVWLSRKMIFSVTAKHAEKGENDFLKSFSPKTNAPLKFTQFSTSIIFFTFFKFIFQSKFSLKSKDSKPYCYIKPYLSGFLKDSFLSSVSLFRLLFSSPT